MHTSNFRIYYEDTDSGGVVYYANYLKFAERARTEMLRAAGISQSKLADESGILFVVRRANLELLKPARLDDLIEVTSRVKEMGGASLTILQEITIGENKIASVEVLVVCINKDFRPIKIPGDIRDKLGC